MWDNEFYSYIKSIILDKKRPFAMADVIEKYPTKTEMLKDTQLMTILKNINELGEQ